MLFDGKLSYFCLTLGENSIIVSVLKIDSVFEVDLANSYRNLTVILTHLFAS